MTTPILMTDSMKVLITGAEGFIGKNLCLRLSERKEVEVVRFGSGDDPARLPALIDDVQFVFHLAGVNRPQDPADFVAANSTLTTRLCEAAASAAAGTGRPLPVVLTSSTQVERDNPYGLSKRAAEDAVFAASQKGSIRAHVFRLPNVVGKWCRPNYNSAVATFCHNIARDLPIQVNDPAAALTLVYVDDLVERFVQLMDGADTAPDAAGFERITPQYTTTVGAVAELIRSFRESRATLMTERVGFGLVRALYSTYVSYLPVEAFAYPLPQHTDSRGTFVEMLKTPDSGQFSYFTAHAGVTRGGHYHHSKTEKFLVIKGQARFKFRHMYTGESHELVTRGEKAEIVETVPGWTHDITNIGKDDMIVMLWANEVFDRSRPDTFACPL